MTVHSRVRTGFSLAEMLIVVAIIAVFAGLVVTNAKPQLDTQIRSTAERLAADMAYCRNLAVLNSSTYSLILDVTNNRYVLMHSGANSALDVLPDSPFSRAEDPPEQHVVPLDGTEGVAISDVSLSAVMTGGVVASASERLEFGPYGETTNSTATTIWLTAGSGSAQRYITVTVDPITGLTWIGDIQALGPVAGAVPLPRDLSGTYLMSGS